MSDDELPVSPLSEMAQAAAAMHELFTSYLRAGFTEPQALYLLACAVCGGPKQQP